MALGEAGVPFEFVPGVTSPIAAPAYAGIPVTQRAMATSFAVVTGRGIQLKPYLVFTGKALLQPLIHFAL